MTKDRKRTGGRAKGTPNKVTVEVKSAILRAFEELGGWEYLVDVGRKKPEIFCALLAKIVPQELKAQIEDIVPVVRLFTSRAPGQVIEAEAKREGEGS